MSQDFINGSKYKFSTLLSAAITITGTTNAAPPAITAAAMPANDDIVLLAMDNWTDLSDTATYADSSGHLFGLDTTDTKTFTAGEGTGSYRVADGFVSLSQIREVTQSGGDTNTFTWGYIDDKSPRQRSKPTDQNPLVLTFMMDRDPNLTWGPALEKLTKSRQLVVMIETLITGEQLIYTGYVSYQKSPSRTRNENMTVTATFTINSEIVSIPANFPSGS